MRHIAVVNSKGGSGKTTTAIHLAAGWARKGKRVLLVDLDPAARASKWIAQPDGGELYQALAEGTDLEPLVRTTQTPGLDIIPSSLHLRQAEQSLIHEPGAAMALAEGLEQMPSQWDAVIFDLPGAAAFCGTLGLSAATDALLTLDGAADLDDLPDVKRTIALVRQRLNPTLKISGLVQVRVNRQTRLYRDLRDFISADPDLAPALLDANIRADARMREAPSHRQTLFDYSPMSNAAEDYQALADEYGKRLEIQ